MRTIAMKLVRRVPHRNHVANSKHDTLSTVILYLLTNFFLSMCAWRVFPFVKIHQICLNFQMKWNSSTTNQGENWRKYCKLLRTYGDIWSNGNSTHACFINSQRELCHRHQTQCRIGIEPQEYHIIFSIRGMISLRNVKYPFYKCFPNRNKWYGIFEDLFTRACIYGNAH